MIKKFNTKFTFQEHLIALIRDELAIEAIKDDGIYSTFKFDNDWLPTMKLTKITLRYCKFDGDGCSWTIVKKYIFYKTCPEIGDATLPSICLGTLEQVIDRIKMDMVKNDNAIWSTIKVQPCYDHFDVSYEKAYVDDKPDYVKYAESDAKATEEALTNLRNKVYAEAGIKAAEESLFSTPRYLRASDLEIENTKRALRRIQENSYYGLYPRRSGLTYFDEKAKESLKASLGIWKGIWKAKAEACDSAAKSLGFVDAETLRRISETFSYGSHNKEEKEKTDMNITLMVVPDGMNKDFVNKVKAYFQSNNSQRLFVSSVDIDYSSEHEPIKTKYDLFENWIKTGKVDVVYFMLGFEKDPDVRAFESFVRGITELSMKTVVNVVYQKDDIKNDIQDLRNAYFDEADAKEDLKRAGNWVVREAKVMTEVYSLNNTGLDIILYSKGKIDASDELVINDIMDTAFASDEDAKPAKKGGKKND